MSAGPSAVEIIDVIGYDDSALELLLAQIADENPTFESALRKEILNALLAAQQVGSVQGAYNPHIVRERWGDLRLIKALGLRYKAYAALPKDVAVTVVDVKL
jgi:hypothetical protein